MLVFTLLLNGVLVNTQKTFQKRVGFLDLQCATIPSAQERNECQIFVNQIRNSKPALTSILPMQSPEQFCPSDDVTYVLNTHVPNLEIPKLHTDCDKFKRCAFNEHNDHGHCTLCSNTQAVCNQSDVLCGYSRPFTCACPAGSEPGDMGGTNEECVPCTEGKYSDSLSLFPCQNCLAPTQGPCIGMISAQCICADIACLQQLLFNNRTHACPQTVEQFMDIVGMDSFFDVSEALYSSFTHELDTDVLCDCEPLETKQSPQYLIPRRNCTSGEKLEQIFQASGIHDPQIKEYRCVQCEGGKYQNLQVHTEESCKEKTKCYGDKYTVDHDNKSKDNTCQTEFSDAENKVFLTNITTSAVFGYNEMRTTSMQPTVCQNVENAQFVLLKAWKMGFIPTLPILSNGTASEKYCPFVCNAGFDMDIQTMTCTRCAPGKFKQTSGIDNLDFTVHNNDVIPWAHDVKLSWDTCENCTAGTYQDQAQATSCFTCPADSFCLTGATSPSNCGDCGQNEYLSPCTEGSTKNNCQPCQDGCTAPANSVGASSCACDGRIECGDYQVLVDGQCVFCNHTEELYKLACPTLYSELTVVCEQNAFFECNACVDRGPAELHAAPDFLTGGSGVQCKYVCNGQRIAPPYYFDSDSNELDWGDIDSGHVLRPVATCVQSTVLNKYECETRQLRYDPVGQRIFCNESTCDNVWKYLFQGQCMCKSGFYADGDLCVVCPEHQESLPGTNGREGCFCLPGYAKVPGGTCIACKFLGNFYENISDAIFCPGGVPDNHTLLPNHLHSAYQTTYAYKLEKVVYEECAHASQAVICDCPTTSRGINPAVTLARSHADCLPAFGYYFDGEQFLKCSNHDSLMNESDVLADSTHNSDVGTCLKLCKQHAILDANQCICDSALFRVQHQGKCVCMAGFYEKEGTCHQCDPGYYCAGPPQSTRESCDVDKTSSSMSKAFSECYCIEEGFFWDSEYTTCRKLKFDEYYTAAKCVHEVGAKTYHGLCKEPCYSNSMHDKDSWEVHCNENTDFRPELANRVGMQQTKYISGRRNYRDGSYYIDDAYFQDYLQLDFLMIKVLECPPLTQCTLTNMSLYSVIEGKQNSSFITQRTKFGYLLQDFAWVCGNNEMLVHQRKDLSALAPNAFRCHYELFHPVIQAASSVPSNLYIDRPLRTLHLDEIDTRSTGYDWKLATEHLAWNMVLDCVSANARERAVFSESDACFDCADHTAKRTLVAVHEHNTFDVPHCMGRETLISRVPSNQYGPDTFGADCFVFACVSREQQQLHISEICVNNREVNVVKTQSAEHLADNIIIDRIWHFTVLPRWKFTRSRKYEALNLLFFMCDAQQQLHVSTYSLGSSNFMLRTAELNNEFCNQAHPEHVFAQAFDRQKSSVLLYTNKHLWRFKHAQVAENISSVSLFGGTLVSASFAWPFRVKFGSQMNSTEDDDLDRNLPNVIRIVHVAGQYSVCIDDASGTFDMADLREALDVSLNDINHNLWQALNQTTITPIFIRVLNTTHAANSDYPAGVDAPFSIFEILLLCKFAERGLSVLGNVQVLMTAQAILEARILEVYSHMSGSEDLFLHYDYDYVPKRAHTTYHNILFVQGRVSLITWEQNSARLSVHSSRFECASCRAGLVFDEITRDCTCPMGTLHVCLPCLFTGMCNRSHAVLDVQRMGCKYPFSDSQVLIYSSHCVPCGVHTNFFCPTPTTFPERCPINLPVSYGRAPQHLASSEASCTCPNGQLSSDEETLTSSMMGSGHITQRFSALFCKSCPDQALCGALLSEDNAILQCPSNTEPSFSAELHADIQTNVVTMSCVCKAGWRKTGEHFSTTHNVQKSWPPLIYAFPRQWQNAVLEDFFRRHLHKVTIEKCEKCSDAYYCQDGMNATCPKNKTRSPTGDTCICADGFASVGDECVECHKDQICQNGQVLAMSAQLQPCKSNHGTGVQVWRPGLGCSACPLNHYCPRKSTLFEHHIAIPCPERSYTNGGGRASLSDCTCMNGYVLQDSICRLCPPDHECFNNEKIKCREDQTSQAGADECSSICAATEYYNTQTRECHACTTKQWSEQNSECTCPGGWWKATNLTEFNDQYLPGLYLWYEDHPLAILRRQAKHLFEPYLAALRAEMPNVFPNCYPAFPGTYSTSNMERPMQKGAHFTVVPAFASSSAVWALCPTQLYVRSTPSTHKAFGFEECFQTTGMWRMNTHNNLLQQLLNMTTPGMLSVNTLQNDLGTQIIQHIVNRNTAQLANFAINYSKFAHVLVFACAPLELILTLHARTQIAPPSSSTLELREQNMTSF